MYVYLYIYMYIIIYNIIYDIYDIYNGTRHPYFFFDKLHIFADVEWISKELLGLKKIPKS